jgi:hypothetical protein
MPWTCLDVLQLGKGFLQDKSWSRGSPHHSQDYPTCSVTPLGQCIFYLKLSQVLHGSERVVSKTRGLFVRAMIYISLDVSSYNLAEHLLQPEIMPCQAS